MIETRRKEPTYPDLKEAVILSQAPWLAGTFETGGSMSIALSRRPQNGAGENQTKNVVPFLSRNGKKNALDYLKDLFGGRVRHQKGMSWQWELAGTPALLLARQMKPYSPSRQTAIRAFEDTELAASYYDKKQIADNLKENGLLDEVTVDQYRELVRNPAFLAGVFDTRGHVYKIEKSGYLVYFYSSNRPLMEALELATGATIDINCEAGTEVTVRDRVFVTERDSLKLPLTTSQTQMLLQRIEPHVQMKRQEVHAALRRA